MVPATCVCPSLGANFPPNQSLWCPPSLPTNQCPPCLPTNHRPFLFGPEWFYFRQAEWVLLPGQPASKYRWLAEEIQTRQWSKYQQWAEEIQTRGRFQWCQKNYISLSIQLYGIWGNCHQDDTQNLTLTAVKVMDCFTAWVQP